MIEWLSPAYALRKLEILFSDCPMGCNAYCIQNLGIRFTHIPMPPVTFNEKGESQIPDYSKTTVRQKTADLTSLTHFRILTILRNAEDIKKREKRLKDAMKDYKIHSEFVKTILNNRTRNRYYRTYFSDMLPRRPEIRNSHPDEKTLHRQHSVTGLFHQQNTVNMPQDKRGIDRAYKELGADPENTLLVDV